MSGQNIMRIEKALISPKDCPMTEIHHLDSFKRAFKEAITMLSISGVMSTIEIWGTQWFEGITAKEIGNDEERSLGKLGRLSSRSRPCLKCHRLSTRLAR